jgi:type I restriction enzyme S subunit
MELMTKQGFKQTEVGLIPEDWDVIAIGNLINTSKQWSFSGGPFGSDLKSSDYTNEGIRVIQLQNIGVGKFINKSKVFTSVEKADYLMSSNIYPGNIIFSKMGDPVARVCLIPDFHSRYVMCSDGIKFVVDGQKYDKTYVFRALSDIGFLKRAEAASTGSTRKRIGLPDLKALPIPLPPTLTEQKAIATALSDVDALIASLEQTITKKKAIKQGAMQELLIVTEDWTTKTIREVATYRRGSFPQPYGLAKWYDDISGMPFVQVVDVAKNKKLKAETKQKISAEGAKMSVFVKKGSVILTIQGSIGRICITQYDAYVDRTLLIFESFKEDFNTYFFMISIWLKFQIEKEKAPGGIIKTITKEALSSFEISFPNREEQDRIAEVLEDIEKEINMLETKKVKYQAIKQGMMQELLTGKTRLI